MDVVYLVKRGNQNEELRYSLRSLINIPHGNVFIAGYTPNWATRVISIPTVQNRSKYENSTGNMMAACMDGRVSQDFILMNDDFFIMQPMNQIPMVHRGPLDDIIRLYKAKGLAPPYLEGMQKTRQLLRLTTQRVLYSYEMHIPMVFNKHAFLHVVRLPRQNHMEIRALHKRTLYGNYMGSQGEEREDVKVNDYITRWNGEPFLSTNDKTFAHAPIGEDIRARFPNKSPYEL